MSKKTLKSIAQRGVTLGAAFAVVAASFVQAVPAYADALNPLTERSLTLSSSSPGWSYTDGSGNTTYAPPNSGANGQKTGNYFSFKTSSADTVKTFSFQYCTTSAGDCTIPGDGNGAGESNLDVVYPSAAEVGNVAGAGTITVTNGSATVTGTGTSFLTAIRPGTVITTAGNENYTVASVASNTSLTLTANAAGTTETGVAFSLNGFNTVVNAASLDGKVKAVPGYTYSNPKYIANNLNDEPAEAAKGITGNFIVMYKSGGVWVQSTGWAAASHSIKTTAAPDASTNNYITLTKAAGQAFTSGQEVKILFFATGTNYITNPGSGAFFVKINTYKVALGEDRDDYNPILTGTFDTTDLAPSKDTYIVDGGVTVANVMNQSIQITTKVLETMEFSVGTVDPNTLTSAELLASDRANLNHTPCDLILQRFTAVGDPPRNVLQLGNQTAESSLETGKAYATHSYWRLSSNSSGGASVYYSGHTLANTSGDEIKAIGTTAAQSAPGSEQFGLALSTTALSGSVAGTGAGTPNFNTGLYGVNYVQDRATGKNWENGADNGKTAIHSSQLLNLGATHTGTPTTWTATDADYNYTNLNKSYHTSRLDPLKPEVAYANGSGRINLNDSLDAAGLPAVGGPGTSGPTAATDPTPGYDTTNAQFAFDEMSDTVPALLATQNTQVVDCVSAKMRYIGNIAATTPAGIYTTKINYIAAPQY